MSAQPPSLPPGPGQPPHPPQGPAPYPYGYAPYGVPMYATQQGNGMAIAGGVLGIVGLVLCWAWFVGAILGVLGIIFGAIGVQRANQLPGAPHKGFAIAGIVCGILAVVLDILLFVFIFAAVGVALHAATVITPEPLPT